MSTSKEQLIAKQNPAKLNPYERAVLNYTRLEEAFEKSCPEVLKAFDDDHAPMVKMNLKRMDHGGWLIVLVRDNDMVTQDVLTGGETILDAFLAMNKKLKGKGWKIADPWPPK